MVAFNDRRKCPSCGQTNPDDFSVMGSMGCDDCGGTLPYKARPSSRHPGHIEVEERDEEGKKSFTIPYWATDHEDPAVRAEHTSFIRQHPDNPKLFQAGTYGPSRSPRVMETGEGKTKQQAVDHAMLNVAGKTGQKWWKR